MTLSRSDLDILRDAVMEFSGNELENGREQIIKMRLNRIALDMGKESLAELLSEIREPGSDRLIRKLATQLLTHESSFFRDFHPFESLREKLIPEAMTNNMVTKSLNIWCAACSSGQEPYSIAMLIHQHFPQLKSWDVNIFATDISDDILQRASAGIFTQQEINRGLPTNLMLKYFTQHGREWHISDDIKSMVKFQKLNLMGIWPKMANYDMIFLRNVLIYFSPENKQRILTRVLDTLRDDGVLLLGGSELSVDRTLPMSATSHGKTVYYIKKCASDTDEN